jgi:glutaredoxin-like protein NrdH
MKPIIGQLTIELDDGTTLTANNDIRLARKWAEHVNGEDWSGMTFVEQNRDIAVALGRIRDEFGDAIKEPDPEVTVNSKPTCVQCDATKRALTKAGVDYKVVDITKDPAAEAEVKAMGFVQAPVVVTEDDRWSGFRPDKIRALNPDTERRERRELDTAAPRSRIAL